MPRDGHSDVLSFLTTIRLAGLDNVSLIVAEPGCERRFLNYAAFHHVLT